MTGRDQVATLPLETAGGPADAGLTPGELAYIQGSIAAMSGGSTVPMGQADQVAALPLAQRIGPARPATVGWSLGDPPLGADFRTDPPSAAPNEAERAGSTPDEAGERMAPRRRRDDHIGQALAVGGHVMVGGAQQEDDADAWLDELRACQLARQSWPRPPAPGTTTAGDPTGGGDADSRDTPRLMTVP